MFVPYLKKQEYGGNNYGLHSRTVKNATLMQLVDWGFSHYQMDEIIKGLQSGVDVSIYADPKCSIIQMSLIRHRLEDVSKKSQYDFYPAQKEIIRKGEEAGVDFCGPEV